RRRHQLSSTPLPSPETSRPTRVWQEDSTWLLLDSCLTCWAFDIHVLLRRLRPTMRHVALPTRRQKREIVIKFMTHANAGGVAGSPANKVWCSLFQECGDAFAGILTRNDSRKCRFLKRETVINRRVHPAMHC